MNVTRRENFADLVRSIMRDIINPKLLDSDDKLSSFKQIWPEISDVLEALMTSSSFSE